jgi:hypothetical protein
MTHNLHRLATWLGSDLLTGVYLPGLHSSASKKSALSTLSANDAARRLAGAIPPADAAAMTRAFADGTDPTSALNTLSALSDPTSALSTLSKLSDLPTSSYSDAARTLAELASSMVATRPRISIPSRLWIL